MGQRIYRQGANTSDVNSAVQVQLRLWQSFSVHQFCLMVGQVLQRIR